ncbi:MAG: cation transporter [Planctomycetota bacterium]|nr:MAG: cation transporter [Planctomycetota bacterium]
MASGSKKAIYAALVGNALIAVTKFIAATITRSSAMFSEGIHSVVDTGNQVLLLFGMRRAEQPPDERFPFGHGKEVYFWSFVVAILIFAVGAGISLYEGIKHLVHPGPIENPTINYIVLAFAIVFESGAWYFAWREFNKVRGDQGYFEAVRRGKDPSMFVVLFEDTAALAGLFVALVGVFLGQVTGILYFDGAASVVIGLILAGTAIWLAYETHGLLIGEGASAQDVAAIREIISRHRSIKHVNEVATMHVGPEYILVNLSVDFASDACSDDVEATVGRIDREIKEAIPRVKRVFVEAESRGARSSPPAGRQAVDE